MKDHRGVDGDKPGLDDASADVKRGSAESFVSIDKMIDALPKEIEPADIELVLGPALDAIAQLGKLAQEAYLKRLKSKTGIGMGALRAVLKAADVDTFRGDVDATDNGYVDVASGHRISTFLLTPTRRVVHDRGVEMIEAEIFNPELERTAKIVFPATALQSRQTLFKRLATLDHQFTGSDENLQAIAKLLSERSVPAIRGTSNIGYYAQKDGAVWLAPSVAISRRGFNQDDSIVCVDAHASISKNLKYVQVSRNEVVKTARDVLPLLVRLNTPKVILPIVAWFVASVFKVQVSKLFGHFPVLWIHGTKGAGKTSVVRQVGRLVGIDGTSKPFSVSGTRFTLIKLLSGTSSVPIFLDEYKPGDMKPQQLELIHRLLRQVYGGEIEERGRADLSVEQFELRAPVVVGGESGPHDDGALRERAIVVRPDKQQLEGSEASKQAFLHVAGSEVERLAVPLIQFSLGQDVAVELENARNIVAAARAKVSDLPLRQVDNLIVAVFGLRMLQEFATSVGVNLELDTSALIDGFLENTLDGARGVRDVFDDFLAECATHAARGDLEEGRDYAFVNGMLCIRLDSFHQVYMEKRMRSGRRDATNGLGALRQVIDEKIRRSEYVVRTNHRVDLAGERPRTIEIDVKRIPEHLHISPFPKGNDRRHGGARHARSDDDFRSGVGKMQSDMFDSAMGRSPDAEPDLS